MLSQLLLLLLLLPNMLIYGILNTVLLPTGPAMLTPRLLLKSLTQTATIVVYRCSNAESQIFTALNQGSGSCNVTALAGYYTLHKDGNLSWGI